MYSMVVSTVLRLLSFAQHIKNGVKFTYIHRKKKKLESVRYFCIHNTVLLWFYIDAREKCNMVVRRRISGYNGMSQNCRIMLMRRGPRDQADSKSIRNFLAKIYDFIFWLLLNKCDTNYVSKIKKL